MKLLPILAIAISAVLIIGCSDSTERCVEPAVEYVGGGFNPSIVDFGLFIVSDSKATGLSYDVGAIHNSVMYQLNDKYPYPYVDPGKSVEDDLIADMKPIVLNEVVGMESDFYDEVLNEIQPFFIDGQFELDSLLSGSELIWWNGLMDYCCDATNSSEMLQLVCDYGEIHGFPLPGSDLGMGLDVLLSSSGFWLDDVGAGAKKNFFTFIMADAGGVLVGAKIGSYLSFLNPSAAAWGAVIGGVFGSAGYLIG